MSNNHSVTGGSSGGRPKGTNLAFSSPGSNVYVFCSPGEYKVNVCHAQVAQSRVSTTTTRGISHDVCGTGSSFDHDKTLTNNSPGVQRQSTPYAKEAQANQQSPSQRLFYYPPPSQYRQ